MPRFWEQRDTLLHWAGYSMTEKQMHWSVVCQQKVEPRSYISVTFPDKYNLKRQQKNLQTNNRWVPITILFDTLCAVKRARLWVLAAGVVSQSHGIK